MLSHRTIGYSKQANKGKVVANERTAEGKLLGTGQLQTIADIGDVPD